jgi:hypothetical protein
MMDREKEDGSELTVLARGNLLTNGFQKPCKEKRPSR